MTGSPTTFIKDEPDEGFSYNPNRIMAANNFNMQSQQYGQFVHNNGDMSAVNPSELTMMSGQYSQGLSNSFHAGNSGIGDDELLESLGGLDDAPQQYGNFNGGYGNQTSQGFFPDNAVAMSQGTGNGQMYSHTPDAGPISSPFTNNGFNYDQYRPNTAQQHSYSNSIPTSMGMQNGSFAARRMHPMERHPSDSRSPMTPTTPGIKSLNLGTPDSGHHQNMLNQHLNQHAKMTSEHWGGNSGSQGSYLDSPIPSPHHGTFHHPQISEIIASGKPPGKGENGAHSASLPTAFQSQEAKKKRRRESHNAVERRRRDNINERIHDLSRLVPQHRLEDEKIRKHINNNGTMSPTLTASGMSPPHATSLLAGGSGRRAAGNITQGLPIEEKDKGPNKGDILNGAVSWTRDLMWLLYQKLEEEEKLQELLTQHGAAWPFEPSEEEKRMRSELKVAVEKNGVQNFNYSRAHGSGLRVPAHTNIAGEPLSPGQSLSPAVQGGGTNQHNQTNLWVNQHSDSSGRGSFSFKEEDEYNMDTGGL